MSIIPRHLRPRTLSAGISSRSSGFRSRPNVVVYTPNAVDFDGTNDYLTRGAGLDGAADSKLVSGGFWINPDTDGGHMYVFTCATTLGGGTLTFQCRKNNSNNILIATNSSTLSVQSTAGSVEAADGWVNVLFSFDMADTGKRHLYINDTSDLATVTFYNNAAIDFTGADWGVGAAPDATFKLNGQLYQPWLAPGVYVDWSVEASRREIITAGGAPAQDIETALSNLGVTAAIILKGDAAGFGVNSGNGGNFTITGSLQNAQGPT